VRGKKRDDPADPDPKATSVQGEPASAVPPTGRKARQARWQQVNEEWAQFVASPAYQDLRSRLQRQQLEPLRQLVQRHGAIEAHLLVDAISAYIDLDCVRKTIHQLGPDRVHMLIDDMVREAG
jgi:hypothetical protein